MTLLYGYLLIMLFVLLALALARKRDDVDKEAGVDTTNKEEKND